MDEQRSERSASLIDEIVPPGLTEREALAIKLWATYVPDNPGLRRELMEYAETLERAAHEARDYAFSLAAMTGAEPPFWATVGARKALSKAPSTPDFRRLRRAIKRTHVQALSQDAQFKMVDLWAGGDGAQHWTAERWGHDGHDDDAESWVHDATQERVLQLAIELQRTAWWIRMAVKPAPGKRGRPRASGLEALCRRAHAAGLTPNELAKVAHRFLLARTSAGLPDAKSDTDDRADPARAQRLMDSQAQSIERLRSRLDQHWPRPVIQREENRAAF